MNIFIVTYYGIKDNSIGSSILSAASAEHASTRIREEIYKAFGVSEAYIVVRQMTKEELTSLYEDIPKVLALMEE